MCPLPSSTRPVARVSQAVSWRWRCWLCLRWCESMTDSSFCWPRMTPLLSRKLLMNLSLLMAEMAASSLPVWCMAPLMPEDC